MAMTPEGKVKHAIKKVLDANKVWYYCPMQNGFGKVGIPDFICCFNGKFLAIEAKAPGKMYTLTPNQQNRIKEIIAHGGWTIVTDNADTVVATIVAMRMSE